MLLPRSPEGAGQGRTARGVRDTVMVHIHPEMFNLTFALFFDWISVADDESANYHRPSKLVMGNRQSHFDVALDVHTRTQRGRGRTDATGITDYERVQYSRGVGRIQRIAYQML